MTSGFQPENFNKILCEEKSPSLTFNLFNLILMAQLFLKSISKSNIVTHVVSLSSLYATFIIVPSFDPISWIFLLYNNSKFKPTFESLLVIWLTSGWRSPKLDAPFNDLSEGLPILMPPSIIYTFKLTIYWNYSDKYGKYLCLNSFFRISFELPFQILLDLNPLDALYLTTATIKKLWVWSRELQYPRVQCIINFKKLKTITS